MVFLEFLVAEMEFFADKACESRNAIAYFAKQRFLCLQELQLHHFSSYNRPLSDSTDTGYIFSKLMDQA